MGHFHPQVYSPPSLSSPSMLKLKKWRWLKVTGFIAIIDLFIAEGGEKKDSMHKHPKLANEEQTNTQDKTQ